MKKIHLIIFILLFFSFNSKSYSNVVYLDIEFLVKNTDIGKSTLDKLNNLNNKNLEDLKKKQNELKEIELNLKNKQKIISEDQFNLELDQLKLKVKKFNNDKDLMVKSFTQKKNKEMDNLLKEINLVIQDYMKKNSIEIVLDKKNVFIGQSNFDITEIIFKEINIKFN